MNQIEQNGQKNIIVPSPACDNCGGSYDEIARIPKNLPCGHTLCVACLSSEEVTRGNKVRCPYDGKIMANESFPKDAGIIDIIRGVEGGDKIGAEKREKIHSMAISKIKANLTGVVCIQNNNKQNDKLVKEIAGDIYEGVEDIVAGDYFSVKIFLFNKFRNFSIGGKPYGQQVTYVDTVKYEDMNWICHAYIVCFAKESKSTLYKQLENFPFIEEDIKLVVIEELKMAFLNRDKYHKEESDPILERFSTILIKKLSEFLVNYAFSVEVVLKTKNEGMLLTKEMDHLVKNVDGTIWISENLSNSYSFIVFVTIFKLK